MKWKKSDKEYSSILKDFLPIGSFANNLQIWVNYQNTKTYRSFIWHDSECFRFGENIKCIFAVEYEREFSRFLPSRRPRRHRLALHSGRHQFYDVFYPISSLALSPWNRIHSKVRDRFERHVGQDFLDLVISNWYGSLILYSNRAIASYHVPFVLHLVIRPNRRITKFLRKFVHACFIGEPFLFTFILETSIWLIRISKSSSFSIFNYKKYLIFFSMISFTKFYNRQSFNRSTSNIV